MLKQLLARKSIKQLLAESAGGHRLPRVLGPVQLTSLGVSMIIGAGIFVQVGEAARTQAGPAVVISFVVAAVACALAALCYAEFSAMVPVAGSAYAYSYASFGELLAWVIGWDLLLEYGVAAAAVAHGASDYVQELLRIFHLRLWDVFTDGPFKYDQAGGGLVATGKFLALPALILSLGVTAMLIRGVRENVRFNVAMVVFKTLTLVLVIGVGACYFEPANWRDFAPHGGGGITFFGRPVWGALNAAGKPVGILAGAATIFFAYIGFDSVSNHAEDARRPSRDIPIGIIASLLLCTVLYIGVGAVLTGMKHYSEIPEKASVAAVFEEKGLVWAQFLVALSAVIAIVSVMLVTMLSQTRIMLAMGRGRLLPEKFCTTLHGRFGTPWKSTVFVGVFVALLSSLLPLQFLTELINIGTLFAFVIVCGGVLVLRRTDPHTPRPFRVPFGPVIPVLGIVTCLVLMFSLPPGNWVRLGVWLLIGLAVYFGYGRRRSAMREAPAPPVPDADGVVGGVRRSL
ncbi:MAG: amino acid permease [Acidobacteria bacterium]|nr:amino acid permease [Acidobacteriota bacterium]